MALFNLKLAPGEHLQPLSYNIKHTFRLFWPIFLGQLANTSMSVVDTIMAGIAGTVELSGVAIGGSFYMPAVLFLIGLTVALQSIIAQMRGGGKIDQIPFTMHYTTVVCLIISVVMGLVVMNLAYIYEFFPDIDRQMIKVAHGYLIAIGFGMPGFALFNILRAYWEGLGQTMPTLVFGFICLFLNIPLNYIFIFGLGPIPAFGGVGCGIATTLTIYITIIFMFIFIKKHKMFKNCRIYTQKYPVKWQDVKAFLVYAFPLAISTTIEVACFSLVAVLLSVFGAIVVASHSIALNVSGMLFMLPLALSSATTIRVGEAMGARHWCRAWQASKATLYLGLIIYIVSFIGLFLLREDIISLYSNDPAVMDLAKVLLLFCCIYMFPDTFQVLMIGILRGFKDSHTIFVITIVAYWLVGMPIGYILGYGLLGEPMQAQGFWIGFICSLSSASLMYIIRVVYIFKNQKLPKSMIIEEQLEQAKKREESSLGA